MHISSPQAGDIKAREDDWITEVEMHALSDPDANQFLLSAFGLPEPGEVRADKLWHKPWLMWMNVLALLACGLLFMYRKLRAGQSRA